MFIFRSWKQTKISSYFKPSKRKIRLHEDVNFKTKRIGVQTMISAYFKPYPKFKPTGNVAWTQLSNEAVNPSWLQKWKNHTRIPSSDLRKAAVLNSLGSKHAKRELKRMAKKYDGPILPPFSTQTRVMREQCASSRLMCNVAVSMSKQHHVTTS